MLVVALALQVVIVPPPCGPHDYACIMQQGQEATPNYNVQQQEQARARLLAEAATAARDARFTRQKVGALLAEGRCADAEKYALRAGDMDLAAMAVSYCAKKGAPTP